MPSKARAGRRDDILATFIRLVAERGYEATNFAQIADDLGIAQGTIVYHFGSKAQMLRECEENYMRRRLAELKLIWELLEEPAERVAAFICAAVLLQATDRDATVATQREIVQLAEDESMQEIRRLRGESLDLLRGELKRGIKSKAFRPVDVGVVSLQIFGAAQWMWTWFEPKGRRKPEEVAGTYIDVFLGGLLVDRRGLARLADSKGPIPTTVRKCMAEAE